MKLKILNEESQNGGIYFVDSDERQYRLYFTEGQYFDLAFNKPKAITFCTKIPPRIRINSVHYPYEHKPGIRHVEKINLSQFNNNLDELIDHINEIIHEYGAEPITTAEAYKIEPFTHINGKAKLGIEFYDMNNVDKTDIVYIRFNNGRTIKNPNWRVFENPDEEYNIIYTTLPDPDEIRARGGPNAERVAKHFELYLKTYEEV